MYFGPLDDPKSFGAMFGRWRAQIKPLIEVIPFFNLMYRHNLSGGSAVEILLLNQRGVSRWVD